MNNTWIQMGVVSWSFSCNQRHFPGVYTSTSYFTDWMKKQIGDVRFVSRAGPACLSPVFLTSSILLISLGCLWLLWVQFPGPSLPEAAVSSPLSVLRRSGDWRSTGHQGKSIHGGGFQSHCFFNCSMKMFLNFVSLKSSSFFLTLARASAPPRGLAVFSRGGSLVAFLVLVPILFPLSGLPCPLLPIWSWTLWFPTPCLVIPAFQQSPGAHPVHWVSHQQFPLSSLLWGLSSSQETQNDQTCTCGLSSWSCGPLPSPHITLRVYRAWPVPPPSRAGMSDDGGQGGARQSACLGDCGGWLHPKLLSCCSDICHTLKRKNRPKLARLRVQSPTTSAGGSMGAHQAWWASGSQWPAILALGLQDIVGVVCWRLEYWMASPIVCPKRAGPGKS